MLKNENQNLSQKTFISCIIGEKTVFTDITKMYPENSKLISEELKRVDPNIQYTYHSFTSVESMNKTLKKWKELKSLDEIIDFVKKDERGSN